MSSSNGRWRPLLGVALILAGLVPARLLTRAVWNWSRARGWTETRATIFAVDVRTTRTTGRRRTQSTKLAAEYEYEWDGASFHNDTVSPFNEIEPFDSYKRKLAAELKPAHGGGEQMTCYVNTSDPSQGFLYREFRWPAFLLFLLFAVVFSGSGILLLRGRAGTAR